MGDAAEVKRRRVPRGRRRRRARGPMTVVEHLDELRSRLIVSFIALGLTSVVAFTFYEPISDFLLRPLCSLPEDMLEGPCKLTTLTPLEGFNVRLKVTVMAALLLASPIWLYQLWAFVTPGLTRKEKRYALPFVGTSLVLFFGGSTFAYLSMPAALRFLVQIGGGNVEPLFRAEDYINFVGLMLIAFGLSFEVPLVLFFLGLAGVISVDQLKRQRRFALVGVTGLAAIVTPTQDPFTMLAMAGPIYLLYEVTILLLSVVKRRKEKRTAPSA